LLSGCRSARTIATIGDGIYLGLSLTAFACGRVVLFLLVCGFSPGRAKKPHTINDKVPSSPSISVGNVQTHRQQATNRCEDDMIEPATTEVQQLIQQGRIAALVGDTASARAHFRRAAELESACAEAWVGLSGVVPILAEKRECLQRALALEPHNVEAQAGLCYVEKLLAGGARIAPSQRAELSSTSAAPPYVQTQVEPTVEYCYNHPERETGLHCVQCAQPICGTCVRVAPVGQLCPKCRKGRRPQQYKVTGAQLLIAGAVALTGSALAAILVQFIGGGYIWVSTLRCLSPR
jgi:hypothetical protein